MSKLIEEFGVKMAAQATEKARNQALYLLARGRDTIEEIAEITELSVEEIEKLAKKLKNRILFLAFVIFLLLGVFNSVFFVRSKEVHAYGRA